MLADHHREMEQAGRALLACAHEDCSRSLTAQYRAFEQAVLEHLEAEETELLPAYAAHAPEEAAAIRGEHAAIRTLLLQVGVEVELHLVRLETLRSLIDTLHAHAAREDAAMYPWAQLRLPLASRQWLFGRIGRSLCALQELRVR